MTKFQSKYGKPVYVTVVTAHAARTPLLVRNFRYDTGDVTLIKEDGCLTVIDGQNVTEIQEMCPSESVYCSLISNIIV